MVVCKKAWLRISPFSDPENVTDNATYKAKEQGKSNNRDFYVIVKW
ncbi:hypothetical protein O9992_15065 [Vibrio lentus]|nr:hypothetical protein [Vibrio lentus]